MDFLQGLLDVLEFLSDFTWRGLLWALGGAAVVGLVAWLRPGPAGWVEGLVALAIFVLALWVERNQPS